MDDPTPDQLVAGDLSPVGEWGGAWSELARRQEMPPIDHDRMRAYRLSRIRAEMAAREIGLCVLVSPISLRYAVDYHGYALFQSHIPTTYLFVPQDGPVIIHGTYGPSPGVDEVRPARALAAFDGGLGGGLADAADQLAVDIAGFLAELGSDNRRIGFEYVNPSVTRAAGRRGLDVVDGVEVVEAARVVKSSDELACIRWSIAVAELGAAKVAEALRPGVSENQLWALLNYTNQANDGGWHDGRMLASGPRINPWLQEASPRRLEPGDLVGFDTDMIGPHGYCADLSRTLHCGPGAPTARQRALYRLAVEEIEHNLTLIRPGITLRQFQDEAYVQSEEFHANAYSCVIHGVGLCDEYPRVNHRFRGPNPYDGVLEAGMVLCVESYVGAEGERDGVKLEQQVVVTPDGHELLTTSPFDARLLGA